MPAIYVYGHSTHYSHAACGCCEQLQHNQLSTLPLSFGDLFSLEELDISQNDFSALPDCICELPRLKVLYMQSNATTAFPDRFGQLTLLRTLHVRTVSDGNCMSLHMFMLASALFHCYFYLQMAANNFIHMPASISEVRLVPVLGFMYR